MNPLDRQPADLGQRHRDVARLLLGRQEGITRAEAVRRLDMDDRAFRQCVEEITASAWLPIVADRTGQGEARYRLAGPNEMEVVNAASHEDFSRALSLHKRSRGRIQAFQAHHGAGSLFLEDVPEELEAEHAT